jgi:aspartate kinase
MTVFKFGGTSVADAAAIRQVTDIIIDCDEKQLLVVLSACSGITDLLYELTRISVSSNEKRAEEIIQFIEMHHKTMLKELLNVVRLPRCMIDDEIENLRQLSKGIALLGECTPRTEDAVVSTGEFLSTFILSEYLHKIGVESILLDSTELLSKELGKSEYIVKKDTLSSLMKNTKVAVCQGFIASDQDGRLVTLGRGGSDYSAAIFAGGLNADELVIWTDVSGVMSADPRIIANAVTIDKISYLEMRQLSFFGAKVLHPDTIKPALDKNIPVYIKNTFSPEDKGTLIVNEVDDGDAINSLVLKKNCYRANIWLPFDNNATDIFNKIKMLKAKGIEILSIQITGDICELCFELKDDIIRQREDLELEGYRNVRNIDVIYINSSKNKTYLLNEIARVLSDVTGDEYSSITSAIDSNYVLLTLASGKGERLMKLLHDNVILRENSEKKFLL